MNLQEKARLENLLKNELKSKEFRDFCIALLSNQIGGPGSSLHISENLLAQRQTLLELLVHLDSVLFSGNPLLVPLYLIASQPQNVKVRLFFFCFFFLFFLFFFYLLLNRTLHLFYT